MFPIRSSAAICIAAMDESIISFRRRIRSSSAIRRTGARSTIPDTFDRNIGGNEASFAGDDDVKGRNMVGAWTRTFSPGTIGDFRYGYTQFNMALLPTDADESAVASRFPDATRTIRSSPRLRSSAPRDTRDSATPAPRR